MTPDEPTDNFLRKIDQGFVQSSAANSRVELIRSGLKQEDVIYSVSPNLLTHYWPPALPEWSTKAVRGLGFTVEADPTNRITVSRIEQMDVALREPGLLEDVGVKRGGRS